MNMQKRTPIVAAVVICLMSVSVGFFLLGGTFGNSPDGCAAASDSGNHPTPPNNAPIDEPPGIEASETNPSNARVSIGQENKDPFTTTQPSKRVSSRAKQLELLDDKYKEKFAGMDLRALGARLAETRLMFDQARSAALDDRRGRGLYIETIRSGARAESQPAVIPKDAIVRVVVNPIEKLAETKLTRQTPNWYIFLTREEYPEIFEMRDEITYISNMLQQPDPVHGK